MLYNYAVQVTVYTDGDRSKLEVDYPASMPAEMLRTVKQHASGGEQTAADRKRAGEILSDFACGLGYFARQEAARACEMFLDLITEREWAKHYEPGEPAHEPDQCALCLARQALDQIYEHGYERPKERQAREEREARSANAGNEIKKHLDSLTVYGPNPRRSADS